MATITLPDDPMERAKKIVELEPAINTMKAAFGDALTIEEGDAVAAHADRPRRTRKARIAPVEPVSKAPVAEAA